MLTLVTIKKEGCKRKLGEISLANGWSRYSTQFSCASSESKHFKMHDHTGRTENEIILCRKGSRGSREKSPWQGLVEPTTELSFLVLPQSHNISKCLITLITLK